MQENGDIGVFGCEILILTGQGIPIGSCRASKRESRTPLGRNTGGFTPRLTQKRFVKRNTRTIGKPVNFFHKQRTQFFNQRMKSACILAEFIAGFAREFINPHEIFVNEIRGLFAVLIPHVVRRTGYFDKRKRGTGYRSIIHGTTLRDSSTGA